MLYLEQMKKLFKVKDIVYIAICTALMCVCSWISIPMAIPFTLQTFGVCLTLLLLGGARGTIAVAAYLLLGVAGVPVFSGFKGGIGAIAGATGGFLIGFIAMAAIYWLTTAVFGEKRLNQIIALIVGSLICYAIGTVWFVFVFGGGGKATVLSALTACVFPFIVPDAAKILLAFFLSTKLKPFVKLEKNQSLRSNSKQHV